MIKNKYTSKRSVLAVPGSSSKMIANARRLNVDEFFLDLEDSVSSTEKDSARALVIASLLEGKFGQKSISVRVNEQISELGIEDISLIVSEAGKCFDSIIIPKVETAEQILEIGSRLSKLEKASGLEAGTIRLQLQIESARGLVEVQKIASASERTISLIFGPGDFAASMGMQVLHIGENPINYPGEDAYHYVLMSILTAARANNLLAIDGPYSDTTNISGLKNRADLSASLGFDGKWVIHPAQIEIVNTAFTPNQEYFDTAARIISYFSQSEASSSAKGAHLFEGKMIDEASRRMAETIYSKGLAAGLTPSTQGDQNG